MSREREVNSERLRQIAGGKFGPPGRLHLLRQTLRDLPASDWAAGVAIGFVFFLAVVL